MAKEDDATKKSEEVKWKKKKYMKHGETWVEWTNKWMQKILFRLKHENYMASTLFIGKKIEEENKKIACNRRNARIRRSLDGTAASTAFVVRCKKWIKVETRKSIIIFVFLFFFFRPFLAQRKIFSIICNNSTNDDLCATKILLMMQWNVQWTRSSIISINIGTVTYYNDIYLN